MVITVGTLVAMCKVLLCTSLFFVWVVRYESITKEFEDYGLPDWLRDLVGILKLSFSVMIIQNRDDLVFLGCLGIIVLMIGALATHYKVKNPLEKTIPAFAVLGLCFFIIYFTINI